MRHCDGVKANFEPCDIRIEMCPVDQPAFCKRHVHQAHLVKWTQCSGTASNGMRCTTAIQSKPPYNQFCDAHSEQAASFQWPYGNLPADIWNEILNKLEPFDRIALALSHKSCFALLKRYGKDRGETYKQTHPIPRILVSYLSGKSLPGTTVLFPNVFDAGQPPTQLLRAEYVDILSYRDGQQGEEGNPDSRLIIEHDAKCLCVPGKITADM